MLRVVLCTIFVALSSATLHAESEDTVEFKIAPLKTGSVLRLSTEISVNVFGKNAQSLSMRKLRESWVLESDKTTPTKLKVAYGEMKTSSSIRGYKNAKPPVANKTYLVSTTGGKAAITTLNGNKVSDEERDFIEKDFIALGKPHPIALMLHGQKLQMGGELASQDVLKSIIADYLGDVGVGEVQNLSARLFARQKYNNMDTAIIWLNLETGGSRLFADSTSKLTGQLVVALPSGQPIAFKLDGPLNVRTNLDHTSSESVSSRGTLSVVILGDLDLPPEERIRTDDDDYIIYGGRRSRISRR